MVAAIRGIGSHPRVRQRCSAPLCRAGGAVRPPRGRRARPRAAGRAAAAAVAVEGLQVRFAAVYLLQANRLDFRVAACAGPAPAKRRRHRARPPRHAAWPRRARQEPARAPTRSMPRPASPCPGLAPRRRAQRWPMPLPDRGHPRGQRHRRRGGRAGAFGEDEAALPRRAGEPVATSLQRPRRLSEQLNHFAAAGGVGQLTGGIAHDFNNLLTVISGSLQVLEDLSAIAADPFAQQSSARPRAPAGAAPS